VWSGKKNFCSFSSIFSVFYVKRQDDFSGCLDGAVVRSNNYSHSPDGRVSAIAYVALRLNGTYVRPDCEPLRVKSLSPAPHDSFFTLSFFFFFFFFLSSCAFSLCFFLFLTRALVLLLFSLHPRYEFFPFY
jgi:hypothetical protein